MLNFHSAFFINAAAVGELGRAARIASAFLFIRTRLLYATRVEPRTLYSKNCYVYYVGIVQ